MRRSAREHLENTAACSLRRFVKPVIILTRLQLGPGLAYLGNLVESVAARGAVVTGYGVAQLGDSINQLIDFGVQISDVAGAQRDRPHPWNFRARHEGVGCIVEPVVRAKFGSAAA
jgi:hypothetical protein